MIKQLSLLTLLLPTLAACSNSAVYDNMRINHRNECRKEPSPRYEECLKEVEKSYDEYRREREEVLEQ
jgi:hypothetical protein